MIIESGHPVPGPTFHPEDVMAQQVAPGLVLENMIKTLMERLEIPSRGEINHLNARLDRLEKVLYQKPPGHTPGTAESVPQTATGSKIASTAVLEIISAYPNGTDFKSLRQQTGFKDKKLRNIIFRLDKTGKIKRIKRGIYKKA